VTRQWARIVVSFPVGARVFLFCIMSEPALVPTQFPVRWILGGSFNRAEVTSVWSQSLTPIYCQGKNAGTYTSTHQYVFTAWCLIKSMDSYLYTGFEVLTAVVMKSPVFWDIMPCWLSAGYRAFVIWLTFKRLNSIISQNVIIQLPLCPQFNGSCFYVEDQHCIIVFL
jgi:hypothetical protein